MLIETTVVGSYPQPNWLIHRDRLGSKVPRVRAPEIWKVEEKDLDEAQDDATLSRSATWSAPGSTSSPTAKCAARAIRTASPPRCRASTSSVPEPRSTAAAGNPWSRA